MGATYTWVIRKKILLLGELHTLQHNQCSVFTLANVFTGLSHKLQMVVVTTILNASNDTTSCFVLSYLTPSPLFGHQT